MKICNIIIVKAKQSLGNQEILYNGIDWVYIYRYILWYIIVYQTVITKGNEKVKKWKTNRKVKQRKWV